VHKHHSSPYACFNSEVEAKQMNNNKNYIHQEQRLEEILFSNTDPVSKSQLIVKLGFAPEVADEIVDRHLTGSQAPVYYERLDFADLDDNEERDTL